jgi:hypothetical protein
VFGKKAGSVINLKSILCLYNLGLIESFGLFIRKRGKAKYRYM